MGPVDGFAQILTASQFEVIKVIDGLIRHALHFHTITTLYVNTVSL